MASFEAIPGVAPDWCPAPFTAAQCAITPFPKLASDCIGNMSTVGQAKTSLPVGHVGSRWECRRNHRHDRTAAAARESQTGVASLARRCRYRNGISDVAVSSWRDDPNRPQVCRQPLARNPVGRTRDSGSLWQTLKSPSAAAGRRRDSAGVAGTNQLPCARTPGKPTVVDMPRCRSGTCLVASTVAPHRLSTCGGACRCTAFLPCPCWMV